MASTLARVSRAALTRCSPSLPFSSSCRAGSSLLSRRLTYPTHSLFLTRRLQASLATAERVVEPVASTSEDLPLETGDEVMPLFSSLSDKIHPDTLKALTVRPFQLTHMSPVQAEVLPLLPELANPIESSPQTAKDRTKDLFVKARTGTGKTIAFLVPAIEARLRATEDASTKALRDAGLTSDRHLENRARKTYAMDNVGTLIISPTRELAIQIASEASRLTTHHDMDVQTFFGGGNRSGQLRMWNKGRKDIVVATPGRLRDVMENEPSVAKAMSKAQVLVLDEADTLLDMGFRDEINAIIDMLPSKSERQTFFFTATVPAAIKQIARDVLSPNHKFINCVASDAPEVHANISQYHTILPSASDQMSHTMRLIAHDQLVNAGHSKVMVFCTTTRMTQLVSSMIRELVNDTLPGGRGCRIYEIHSKKSQDARTNTSDRFRQDKSGCSILITSDVSARGVDYPGVTRVIQIGIPSSTAQYVHRVGRTGRAGLKGRADLVLLPWESGFVNGSHLDATITPVSVEEIDSQLLDVAKQFDENPVLYWTRATEDLNLSSSRPSLSKDRFRRGAAAPVPDGPRMFRSPISPTVASISSSVKSLIPELDEEVIKDTFASMLGYYVSKAQELRARKGDILEGCKIWATEGFGLAVPPYISKDFLKKLGFDSSDNNSRAGRGGRERGGYGMKRTERDQWVDHAKRSSRPDRRGGGGGGGRESAWMEQGRQGSSFSRTRFDDFSQETLEGETKRSGYQRDRGEGKFKSGRGRRDAY